MFVQAKCLDGVPAGTPTQQALEPVADDECRINVSVSVGPIPAPLTPPGNHPSGNRAEISPTAFVRLADPGTNRRGPDVEENVGAGVPSHRRPAHRGVTDLEEAQAMGELQPRMRAGDKDRQRVVDQLGKHFGEGRLTVQEFDERIVRAHASVYLDELPALTADLPRDPEPQPEHPRRSRPQMRVPALVLLIAMLLAWSMVAVVIHAGPPLFVLFLLFLLLRHRRWSRRW
jgi:hypothetical protein